MKLIISLALVVLFSMSPYALVADNNDVEVDASNSTAQIDAAMEEFNNRVDTLEKWVMDEFDELIDSYANRGDIKQVEELQNQKQLFLEQGTFPDGKIFTVMRRRASVDLLRANRFLDNVYETVIEDLTKEKNFNEAKRLQKEWEAVKSKRPEQEKEEVSKLPTIKKRSPLKKDKPVVNEVSRLNQSLSGSVWLHHYKGGSFEYGFGRDGFIHLHDSWRGCKWRITGPREVTIYGTTGATFKFLFNDNVMLSTDLNWDGKTPSTSSRTNRFLSE